MSSFRTAAVLAIIFTLVCGCKSLLTSTTTPGIASNSPPVVTYAPSATASNVAAVVQSTGSYLPAPWGEGVEALGALAFGALALYARNKTTAAANSESMVSAAIKGVENLTLINPAAGAAAKQAVQAASVAAGVAPQLAATVASQTVPATAQPK
jgi:hypothetical protein